VNHPDLQRYWLAAKVSGIEEALEMGKAYFQVEEPKRPSYTARQVVKEDEETTPPPTPQVAAAETESPEQTQLTMLMDMVKGLQATVTKLQRDQADSPIAGRPCLPLFTHLLGVRDARACEETLS